MVSQVRVAVIAGAYYINVFYFFSGRQPAWACLVTEPVLVYKQTLNELFYKFFIGVQVITTAFRVFFEFLV